MPDADGKLGDPDKKVLDEWITTHPQGGMKCPICRTQNWRVLPQLVAMPPVTQKGAMAGGGHFNYSLEMVCGQCAVKVILHAHVVENCLVIGEES